MGLTPPPPLKLRAIPAPCKVFDRRPWRLFQKLMLLLLLSTSHFWQLAYILIYSNIDLTDFEILVCWAVSGVLTNHQLRTWHPSLQPQYRLYVVGRWVPIFQDHLESVSDDCDRKYLNKPSISFLFEDCILR